MNTMSESSTRDGRRADRLEVRTERTHTETRKAFRTTELWIYVIAAAATLVATYIQDDSLTAWRGWLLVAVMTTGYMVSRGMAKIGNSEPRHYTYDDRA